MTFFKTYLQTHLRTLRDFSQRSELSRFLLSFKREFAYAFWFTALINVLMLTPTLYMLQIFDRVLVSQSEFTLYAVTLMLLFFLGIMSFSEWVRARLLVRLGVKLDMRLNERVFNTAFIMQNQGRDKEAAQLFTDLSRVRQFLTGAGLFAILDAPWTPIYLIVLSLLHPFLGILSFIFCLMLAAVAYISGLVMKTPLEESSEAARKESVYLDGKLRHASVVESMGMLGNMRDTWASHHQNALVRTRRGLDAQTRMQSITRFVRLFQQSLCLGAGAFLVILGKISPGAMIASNALMGRATHPVDALMNAWKSLLDAKKSYLALEAALEEHPHHEPASLVGETVGAALTLEQVSATAEHRATPILDDISFTLPAGSALGIMGPSGSGKSTLARVILGIWPQTEGDVRYDDMPIRDQDRVAIGAELGYLPQDVELFSGTIAENIARFGQPDPSKIIEACQAAGVHDMILRFPKGYDTEIGEEGRILSGGQRQRIGLARALYNNPRLVVLDEPNANLDDAGDHALVNAVMALKQQGVTLVLITHRPQIMSSMDFVLMLDKGKVVQFGKPKFTDENPAPPKINDPRPVAPAPASAMASAREPDATPV
ncbi:MAG: type I secretion system permease/ATPase [Zoogloeaceae bacterium]|jgi:ATP-binding cassette subfamily C exporter for protease/lipase|nr:type I secretion system permease/ATPase [Zoogloeaceae bacterium]